MAQVANQAVGCLSLIPLPDGSYEVAKMAVSLQSRGRGIGRQLLETAVHSL